MKELAMILCMAAGMFGTKTGPLTLTSPAFKNNAYIPQKYSCEGDNVNPPLEIANPPKNTKTFALVVEDPDAEKGTFNHWVMWNIPVQATIDENSKPGIQGDNGKDDSQYTGPCPPSVVHHYHFKLYALDAELTMNEGVDKKELEKAMEGHILAKAELVGLYEKHKQ